MGFRAEAEGSDIGNPKPSTYRECTGASRRDLQDCCYHQHHQDYYYYYYYSYYYYYYHYYCHYYYDYDCHNMKP